MYFLAGYKALGRTQDQLVRVGTVLFDGRWAIYTHVELVTPWGMWYSSSKRDGGVRRKAMTPKYGHWDYCPLPDEIGANAVAYMQRHLGRPYDFKGAVLGPVFGLQPDSTAEGLFCIEYVAPAIGWPDRWTMTPGAMMRRASRLWGIQYDTMAPFAGCDPATKHQPC